MDPKAHGFGFLYPPKHSPEDWEEDVPQWTYEMWDYIVRSALELPKETPSWLDIPQMMRLTVTTYNVLEMLGEGFGLKATGHAVEELETVARSYWNRRSSWSHP